MAHDSESNDLERYGRAIRAAYRPARLSSARHVRHRARIAAQYPRSRASSLGRAAGIAAACVLIGVGLVSVAIWNARSPQESDRSDEAVVMLTQTASSATAAPMESSSPSAPTASPIGEVAAHGFDTSTGICRTTPTASRRPGDESQAGFTDSWYGEDPGDGLWAGLGPEHAGIWTNSSRVLWWRANPVPIEVTGSRLDGDAPPLDANLFEGYAGLSHQISVLTFPEPGCWEIEASAGDAMQLRIVVEVVPYEETPGGIQAQRAIDLVAHERAIALPHPVPDTCAVDAWSGPERGPAGQYPPELTDGVSWQYSYYLDDTGLTLNTRLGLLFEGGNHVFWISDVGVLPENAQMTASVVDDDGTSSRLTFERPDYDIVVHSGENTFLTVHGMDLSFPTPGCWEIRVEADGVDFAQTVHVYPRHAAYDHERIYVMGQDGSVLAIDLETGQTLFEFNGGIDVDAAISPNEDRLYLANLDNLSALDAITGTEIWRVPIQDRAHWPEGSGPATVAVSPNGERLFLYSGSAPELQWVQIFDARDGARIDETSLMSGNCPASMHPSTDGATVYLVCIQFGGVRGLDIASGDRVDSVSGQFSGAVTSPDEEKLYAVTPTDRVIAIDMNSREVVEDTYLELPGSPTLFGQMVAVSSDGERLYLGLGRDDEGGDLVTQEVGKIAVVELASGEVLDVLETDFRIDSKGLLVDRENRLYVISGGQVMRLTGSETESLPIGITWEIRQFIIASPGE